MTGGRLNWRKKHKKHKIFGKINNFQMNKKFELELGHWCNGASEHLDTSALTHSIIWRIILRNRIDRWFLTNGQTDLVD